MLDQKGMSDPEIEQLINDVMAVYLNNGFIRANQVVGHYRLDKICRKDAPEVADVFDEITHDYVGVQVTGNSVSRSIWVPSQPLHEALSENTDVIVLRSPRKEGISVEDADYCTNQMPGKGDMI